MLCLVDVGQVVSLMSNQGEAYRHDEFASSSHDYSSIGSENQPLRQVGIYRKLPNFDPSIKGLTAIVCGATGISGFNALRALLSSPDRWTVVYTISRGTISEKALELIPSEQRSRIRHISVDFTSSPESIAKSLHDVHATADYVFFFSYSGLSNEMSDMDPRNSQNLVDVNVPLLRNFLEALPLAQINPKRILLQTGGKNYGMHIGRTRTPFFETDPQPRHLGPNFYYPQEDLLGEYCKVHPETRWNIVMPCGITGASPIVGMRAYSFAIYAVVQQHKGEPLYFGSDADAWHREVTNSTAQLTGFLSEWAVLEDKCANQAFNAQDGCVMSWDRFFNELARWYGVAKGVVGPEEDLSNFTSLSFPGGEKSPLGYGPPVTFRRTFTLGEWFAKDENRKAWEEIVEQSGGLITANPWKSGAIKSMLMGDFGYMKFGSPAINKAKRYGFNGYVDMFESIFEQYQEMAKLGFLPPMKVDTAMPLV